MVLAPVLEEGEIFDSNLLRDTITGEISKGNRNFAIDFAGLDYVYSDTINVLLSLNRMVLDVSGRLSILSPGPEVVQILRKTGVHNILKIYESELDLQKSSEDIILQTSSFKLTDIKKFAEHGAPEKPKSEFDDFRSEMETALPGGQEEISAPPRQRPQMQGFTLDDSGGQFAPQQPAFGEGIDAVAPPPSRRMPQPEMEAPQARQRQYAPPPPPPMPQQQRMPYGQQQMPQQQYYAPPQPQQVPSYEPEPPRGGYQPEPPSFEAPPAQPEPMRKPAPMGKPARPLGRFPEDIDEELLGAGKKSHVGALIITIISILVVSAGAIFVIKYYLDMTQGQQAAAKAEMPAVPAVPAVPEIPDSTVPTPPPVESAVRPVAAEPEPAAVRETRVRPAVRTVPRTEPRRIERTVAPTPPPAAAGTAISRANKMTVVSNPPGATVKINGRVMGSTPYVWDTPIYGAVAIAVSKPGYREAAKTIEFTGGAIEEFITLEQEAVAPPPPPPAPREEPVAPAPVVQEPPPPAPVVAQTPVAPAPPEPVASGSGGDAAVVFIASIPPVADVYMDGKLIGKTNVTELKVLSGTHSMKFVKSGKEITKEMTFQPGKNPSQMVKIP